MMAHLNLENILEHRHSDFAAKSEAHDAADSFVTDNYDMLRSAKLFSALVPQAYGGGGVTHRAMCDFLRGMAQSCPSTALALAMHQHLVAAAAANDKAGRPGKVLLEKVAAGELVLVSTGANDWLESNGSAEKVEGGYRINATKPFASGSPAGNLMVTSAAHDGENGSEVLHFALPLNAEGISLLGDWAALGMRGTGSQTIKLENVFVPDAAIALRRPRGPFHPAFAVILTVAMPLIMSAYLGVAETAAAKALETSRKKADDPTVQLLAGELENLLTVARLAVADMVNLAEGYDFEPSAHLASTVLVRKTLAANSLIATAEKAVELAGGSGFLRRTGIERLLRDIHGAQFHPLPEKRQQLFTGRLALGLDPVAV